MPKNPVENCPPLQPQAATVASAQFMRRPPSPVPPPTAYAAAVGSSVLNLASILNPLPVFDSKGGIKHSISHPAGDTKEESVEHSFSLASHLPASNSPAIVASSVSKTDTTMRKQRPLPTTTPSLPQTTTLVWQPVETPRDHGGVERPFHLHYQEQGSSTRFPVTSAVEHQQPQFTAVTTTVRPANGGNTSSPTSSNGFYHYYHYPTPESPKYCQEETNILNSRKRSLQDETCPADDGAVAVSNHKTPKYYHRNEKLLAQEKTQKSKSSLTKKGQLASKTESQIVSMAEPSSSSPLFTTFSATSTAVTTPTHLPPLQTHLQPSLSSLPPSSTPPTATTPPSVPFTPPASIASSSNTTSASTGDQTKKVVKRRGRPPKPASEKKKKAPVDPAVKKAAAATAKKAGKDQERSKEEKRYCTCHRTFISPLFMIPCNECQNWFHGACMGVTFSEAAFFDLYYCPDCTSATDKSSTKRPICARSSCTNPSNITTWGATRSKYCSFECGLQTARDHLNKTLCHSQDNTADSKDVERLLRPRGAQLGHELNMEQNRRDRKQIEKIKRNASKLKAEAKLVNRKLELLQQILVCQSTAAARGSEMDICGFDSRLTWQDHVTKAIQRIYAVEEGTAVAIDFDADIARNDSMYTICDRPRKCPVHEKWREDKRAELACERRLYLEKIASYDRNLKHLRRRIHQRLQKGDTWEFLENGTIQHNIHTTTD